MITLPRQHRECRGKNENGEWVYGWPDETFTYIDGQKVEPKTITQLVHVTAGDTQEETFEWYEGDIDESGYILAWNNNMHLFCLHYARGLELNPSSYPAMRDFDFRHPIGNIFDNPELICKY